jgi:hypothetical protein
MPAIIAEQRFQVEGLVSEESAVRIGRMFGCRQRADVSDRRVHLARPIL